MLQCCPARGGRACVIFFLVFGRVRGSALKPRVTSPSPLDLGFRILHDFFDRPCSLVDVQIGIMRALFAV